MSQKPEVRSPRQLRAQRKNALPGLPGLRRPPQDIDQWQDLVSQRIDEAMAEGVFDNLPGQGKPLNLNENPNQPPDMAMANKILKNNDVSPAWIGERKKLLQDVENLRGEMARRWASMQADWAASRANRERLARRWADQIAAWTDQIAALNSRIQDLNLTLPIWRMELLRLHLDDELARMGAPRRIERGWRGLG